jgi:arylsulfatase A-like enzyme
VALIINFDIGLKTLKFDFQYYKKHKVFKPNSTFVIHILNNGNMKYLYQSILFSCLFFLVTQKGYSEKKPPNIVFILVDDMGYYDLSCYGATEVETAQIDKLAEEGLRFTDFYAAAPISSPSRAGLLTGCYPRRVGNHIWVHRPDSKSGLNPKELTMAELFKQNGYKTACIGKWHLGFEKSFLPRQQGFDHYFGLLHNLDHYEAVHYKDEGGVPVLRNGEVIQRPAEPSKLADMFTDEAMRWITSHVEENSKTSAKGKSIQESKPFFLYFPHTMLHHPLGVSDKFSGASNRGEYGDAILELDYHVGRLMDKLRELGVADNTVVVYMSDNGRGPGRNPNQPIRGAKLTTLEGGLRVPCIVWGPDVGIQMGKTLNVPAHAMDWYPTLASLAGIKIPDNIVLDGRDLSSLIKGKTEKVTFSPQNDALNAGVPLRRYWDPSYEWSEINDITREEYLNAFFYHGSAGELAAVRSGKWKLHLDPTLKLYNLEKDPGERNPVNNSDIKWKLRGLAVLFQHEMRLCARPAGHISSNE